MKTVEQLTGRWAEVFSYYNLPEINPRKHYAGECPNCGKRNKLRIDDKNGSGSWICVCGSGYGMDLLIQATGKDFKTLVNELDELFGFKSDSTPVKRDTSKRDKAIQLFRSSQPLRGTDAEVYLQSRGIFELPTGGVKFGSAYDHTEKRSIPAMIALASTEFTEPRQMHLTYIENGQKAQIQTARKMHSLAPKDLADQDTNEPIAIKLFQSTNVLGVAEGIETALSAKQLYRVPTWSTMNATYMKRFRAPTGVETLYLFADNDRSLTGLAAAMECARANLLCNNDVTKTIIRWPETKGDFNDVVCEGDNVLEWRGER